MNERVSHSDLAQIFFKAASFSERLGDDANFTMDVAQLDEQEISKRLTRWCEVAAQGNWEKFQKRLQWDGLDLNTVRPTLSGQAILSNKALPDWIETLQEIIQCARDFNFQVEMIDLSKIENLNPIDPENPLPFEDVLLPVIFVARQKLLIRLGTASLSLDSLPLELLNEQSYLALERNLLIKLVSLCTKTLEFEFSQSRPVGHNLLNLMIGEIPGPSKKVYYRAFVQKLLSDGFLAFFQKYPVLGRLIVTTINFWVNATVEFLQRLKTDLPKIQQVFAPVEQAKVRTGSLGKVIKIKPALSDPHNHGHSVIALKFETGLKLIYKPKALGMEIAFAEFLDWCNHRGVSLPFKVVKVLNCQGYGWVEYLEQQPCEDEEAAQRFYKRAGMLLCLLYVLGGTDCHHENLVASGEHLVLVDMETLMHPEVNPITNSLEAITSESPINQQFWDSVLRTGLLPRWDFGRENRIAYDVSGLGSIASQQVPWRVPRWKSVNTDDMHLAYENMPMPIHTNMPILNGKVLSPNDYLDELVFGFQHMYSFLIEQRQTLLAANGPLAALSAQQIRFVFRPTQVYDVILQRSLTPENLQNGVDRSIELDLLGRAFVKTHEKPNSWPILEAEHDALEQLDIPYFGSTTDSDALTVGLKVPLERYFKESSYDRFITRLQKLNETTMAQQVGIIRDAFYARVARTPQTQPASTSNMFTFQDIDFSQIAPLAPTELLNKALVIAQEIQERAIEGIDDGVNWIGLSYIPNAERFQLQPLSENLYAGQCGIALFLAALDYVSGNHTQFRHSALGALRLIQSVLRTSDTESAQRFAKLIGIGGAAGLGSIIYALVRISQFLGKPELLEDAQRAASLITPEVIAADQQLDVITGAAGAILGLMVLYNETGESAVLDKAITCGHHLLAHRVASERGLKAWSTLEEKLQTGFSHGAAGIVYALLRLYVVTHHKDFLDAALEGIAYERSVFVSEVANWPDFQSSAEQNGRPGFRVSWCSGAPGIGLARLGGLSICPTEEIYQDVEVALQTTQNYSWQGVDHLCCGNFGRIDTLLVAAQKLSRPDLEKIAQQRAAWVVARAEQRGGYQLFANLPTFVSNPSFFQGIAGIGYELLRLREPAVLPSVLLWE